MAVCAGEGGEAVAPPMMVAPVPVRAVPRLTSAQSVGGGVEVHACGLHHPRPLNEVVAAV